MSASADGPDGAALALLEGALAIESPSGREAAVAGYFVDRMQALGYDRAFVDEAGNSVGVLGDGPRQVVLLGHIDTVPGVVPLRREGERLYGRGAVDAKGPFAAFVAGVARAGRRPGWSVVVVGAVEEEAASSKGARHAASQWRPEACVIGEPSGWDALTLGYKGRLLVDYRCVRPLAHSAGPERSPPEHGVLFWNALVARAEAEAAAADAKGVFERISPALLSFHTPQDGLFQTVSRTVSMRTPVGFDSADWRAFLTRAAADPELGGGGEVMFQGEEVAWRGDKNNPLVRAFLGAVRDQGGKPGFKVKSGTSDMCVVGPAWRCPILAYGPGDSKLDHTPDEHVLIPEYLRGVAVVQGAVERLTAES